MIEYKQGMTRVMVDGDKTIITNTAGWQYIKDNVERIFGMGEYDKIMKVKYSVDETIHKINPHSITVEIVSPYIPERAQLDLEKDSLPGTNENLVSKYFKGK